MSPDKCPYCKSERLEAGTFLAFPAYDGDRGHRIGVYCKDCGVRGPTNSDTKEEAWEKWVAFTTPGEAVKPPVPLDALALVEAYGAAVALATSESHHKNTSPDRLRPFLDRVYAAEAALRSAYRPQAQPTGFSDEHEADIRAAYAEGPQAQTPGADTRFQAFVDAAESIAGDYGNLINTPIGHPFRSAESMLEIIGRFTEAYVPMADHFRDLIDKAPAPSTEAHKADTREARPVKLRAAARHKGGGSHLRLEVFENGEWNGCHAAYDPVKAFDEAAYRINHFEAPANPPEVREGKT